MAFFVVVRLQLRLERLSDVLSLIRSEFARTQGRGPGRRRAHVFRGERLDSSLTQHYRWVVIPPFDSRGLLPEGLHWAEWDEITDLYHKILGAYYEAEDRRRALRYIPRLEELLRQHAAEAAQLDVHRAIEPGGFGIQGPQPNVAQEMG